jgi:hypothetical protein
MPRAWRIAIASVVRGATIGGIIGALVIAAIVGRSWLFRSPSNPPAPTTRTLQASVAPAAPPAVATQPTVVIAQRGVTAPQALVNEPSPRSTTAVVSRPSPARSQLFEIHARAVRREHAAASLYTSAKPVLSRPQASDLARQARAALAGVHAATARIADYAAAFDRTEPGRFGALLRDAESADGDAAAQSRRLHATVARARALAKAPVSPSRSQPPPTSAAASTPVEEASPVPRHASPAASLSEEDRWRYTSAVHSYHRADACYRDLVADLSRAYRTQPAYAERNRELSHRVRALYERLRALDSNLAAFAGGGAHRSSSMQEFQLQLSDFVAQCHAMWKELDDSRR